VNFLLNRSSAIVSSSVDAFLGIPYGEAPVGERRFRKPLRKQPWSRSFVYDATHLSNSCYQMIIDFLNATGEKIWAPSTPMSEDCLYLNIWAPRTARQQHQPLAVMVWIYGGGFTSGSVSSDGEKTNHICSIEEYPESLRWLDLECHAECRGGLD
jgi:carboxylesterase type B